MRKKLDCNECKALEEAYGHTRCLLGYKIKDVYYDIGWRMGSRPLEPCPKPKT